MRMPRNAVTRSCLSITLHSMQGPYSLLLLSSQGGPSVDSLCINLGTSLLRGAHTWKGNTRQRPHATCTALHCMAWHGMALVARCIACHGGTPARMAWQRQDELRTCTAWGGKRGRHAHTHGMRHGTLPAKRPHPQQATPCRGRRRAAAAAERPTSSRSTIWLCPSIAAMMRAVTPVSSSATFTGAPAASSASTQGREPFHAPYMHALRPVSSTAQASPPRCAATARQAGQGRLVDRLHEQGGGILCRTCEAAGSCTLPPIPAAPTHTL